MSNQKLAAALRNLAQLAYTQNGNRYEDVNQMIASANEALAEHDNRTFSDDVADMVERARAILRSQVCSITQADKLVAFMHAGYNVAEHAFENPAYREPQA